MAAANYLPDVLETTEAERLATGFIFTEGPLWHPDGYYYFVDLRNNRLHRVTPGKPAELVANTQGGNGTTFDLQGRLVICEGDARRVSRLGADGKLYAHRRALQRRALRPAERHRVPLGREPVFHQSRQAHPLQGPRDSGPAGSRQPVGRRRRLPHRDRRRGEHGGELRVSQRPRVLTGREDAVRRQHALVEIHPLPRARCGGQGACGAASSPT